MKTLSPAKSTKANTQQWNYSYLRQKELLRDLPFSAATLWRKVRNGTFPHPVKLSSRITAWDRSQVIAWMESKGGAL